VLDAMLQNEYADQIHPNTSCFASCILSAIEAGAWHQVLELNTKMLGAGLRPDAAAFQGAILACSQLGDQSRVIEEIEAAIRADAAVDLDGFLLCASLLLPMVDTESRNIEEIRLKLRRTMDRCPEIKEEATQLIRSLRLADIESGRKPSGIKSISEIVVQREILWRQVMENTVNLSRKIQALADS